MTEREGVEVINLGNANVRIIQRTPPQVRYDKYLRRNYMSGTWREYEAYPRVYVSPDETFNVAENFLNRERRPYNDWRQPTKDALAAVGVAFEKMNWSKSAGCSMCPCSPGFILKNGAYAPFSHGHFDIWVTLKGAPSVDESKDIDPGRIAALESLSKGMKL